MKGTLYKSMDLSNISEIKFVIYEFKIWKWISLHTRLMDDLFLS